MAGKEFDAGRSSQLFDGSATHAAPLRVLVNGLRAVDVSTLSGVSQSTVSRLWDNRRWIERVEGATLCKLMAVSPSVGEYVRNWGESQRLEVAVQSAIEVGVVVRRRALADLLRATPASAVIAVLSAVAEMMQGNYDHASRLFASSWGQKVNSVADTMLAEGPAAVFGNLDAVLEAADTFVSTPPVFTDRNQIVGYGIVEHKLIKSGVIRTRQMVNRQQNTHAFLTRSAAIAQILSEDDLGYVDRYRDQVFARQSLTVAEVWSHATYAHDLSVHRERLSNTTSLVATATMTAADINSRNDAYVYYLLAVLLPLLLKVDPRLVERHPQVAAALKVAVEERTDRRIRAAAHKLWAVSI